MIYVTAGGGNLGREFVGQLVKRGARVRALVTGPEAAKAAGVKRVVKLSAFGADANAEPGAKRVHGQSEDAVRRSGLQWTFLRPQFFMQNMLWFVDEIKRTGAFSLPMASGRVGMIDFRDIAAVAARCLTESGHEGQVYKPSCQGRS